MNAVVQSDQINLPAPVARRGITEAQWRTLDQLYPGAKGESKVLVWDYCTARDLDPMKKPCHIVPMQVKNQDGEYIWRDVVMPGIYEYRTTAMRTKQYLGHSKPEYGELKEHLNVTAPEYCELTVYRWNEAAKARTEFPVRVYFRECAATKRDKKTGQIAVNERWSKAPIQMLTKCTEAAALREAFPDEFGGEATAEEMEGREVVEVEVVKNNRIDPRPDTSNVDFELVEKYIAQVRDIFEVDAEEYEHGRMLRSLHAELVKDDALYTAVLDKLAETKVLSKAAFNKYLTMMPPKE